MKGLPVNREKINRANVDHCHPNRKKQQEDVSAVDRWAEWANPNCELSTPSTGCLSTGGKKRTYRSENRYLRIHLSVVKAARG
jgi:hypothetical protein